jgi:hypothetical protein
MPMVFVISIIGLSQSLLILFGLGLLYLADCLLNLWLLTPFIFKDCAHRNLEKGGSLGGNLDSSGWSDYISCPISDKRSFLVWFFLAWELLVFGLWEGKTFHLHTIVPSPSVMHLESRVLGFMSLGLCLVTLPKCRPPNIGDLPYTKRCKNLERKHI